MDPGRRGASVRPYAWSSPPALRPHPMAPAPARPARLPRSSSTHSALALVLLSVGRCTRLSALAWGRTSEEDEGYTADVDNMHERPLKRRMTDAISSASQDEFPSASSSGDQTRRSTRGGARPCCWRYRRWSHHHRRLRWWKRPLPWNLWLQPQM